MVRKIIKINRELCDGCGDCVTACHESAIQIVNGKATLIRDDYCDGLGDCLPACHVNAITFEDREALPYDEKAVEENIKRKKEVEKGDSPCSCEGMTFDKESNHASNDSGVDTPPQSMLKQWPIQIKLTRSNAQFFDNANLLVAADCTSFAYSNFHQTFMKNKITIIGCPKLDNVDYTEKLTDIIKENNINSITVVRMEVPCCTGLALSVEQAIQNSGKIIPYSSVIISTDGKILNH